MKCPLTFKTTDDDYGNLYINGAECLKEECAWWDTAYDMCILRALVRLFDGTLMDLNQIRDALQRLGQTVSVK